MTKKIIPCFYLLNEKLVKGFSDHSIIAEDPVAYIVDFSVNGADNIIIFDLSDGDEDHENALLMIRKITKETDIPVIGAGNIKRLEDVKKLIYAGCKYVALNMAKSSNIDLIEEASKRFLKKRIMACADVSEQIINNLDVLKKNVSCCLLLENMFLEDFSDIPVIVVSNDINLDGKSLLKKSGLYGISGDFINSKGRKLFDYKDQLKAEGINVEIGTSPYKWEDFKKDDNGLVTVAVQDIVSKELLMVAYMNEEAFNLTVRTGIMTYYSRSRKCLWKKGDTSGHYQYVKSLKADCDMDTILAEVVQIGNACHTGSYSCFFNEILSKEYDDPNPYSVLEDVMKVIEDRKENPKEGSYTNYLFDKGIDKILKKVGEEATEIVIAAKNPEPEEAKYEIADFLYHVMVLMALKGISWEEVLYELANR